MTTLKVLFVVAIVGCFGPALCQDAESGPALVREPRGHRKRLCKKYGICGNQGFGGYQQGYHQGYQGVPPAINIGITQSQSSASAGGGGYSNGYYPNNYQHNHGFPNQGYGGYQGGYGGYQGGYGANHGYGGFPNQGYGGRPGFGNGQGSYNNQFNGNYYGPAAGNGGPFQGPYYDEEENDDHSDLSQQEQHDQALFGDGSHDSQGPHGPQEPHGQYSLSGSFALAGRKNN